ncbi:helix-turn-helix transcriptional regulator [Alteromonas sp. NFXS44]|uniref:winged helix-turn-helix transcriptional regulator n=1 Tax=Alteromonas sp. NFXS44 TaxID=2818435 RepID=UPI0032DE3D1C
MSKTREAPNPFLVSENCLPRRINFLFSSKWTSMVLYILNFKTLRTGELMRTMPGISKKMMTQTLRELEELKLIHREVYQVVPPMVEYSLTDLGKRFVEPLLSLYDWAEDNSDLLDKIEEYRKLNGLG